MRKLKFEELDEESKEIVESFQSLYGNEDDIRVAIQGYAGKFKSKEEFFQSVIKTACQWSEIPEVVKENINWDGVAEDLSGYFIYNQLTGHAFNKKWVNAWREELKEDVGEEE